MNALQTYLSRFDILIEPSTVHSVSLHFGLRIAADVVAGSPVIAVFQGQHIIGQEYISPLLGLRDYQARNLGNMANLAREYWHDFIQLAADLYRCYLSADALLIQLESLKMIDGRIVATHCTLHLDQNADFRKDPLLAGAESNGAPNAHGLTRENGIAFLPLKGQIGVLANGAGLAMAAMDMIAHYSNDVQRAGSFMDLGNDLRVEKLAQALLVLRGHEPVRAILITLFAANQCAYAAHTLTELPHTIPTVVFLSGTDSESARALIERKGNPALISAGTLREAVRRAIHTTTGSQVEGV